MQILQRKAMLKLFEIGKNEPIVKMFLAFIGRHIKNYLTVSGRNENNFGFSICVYEKHIEPGQFIVLAKTHLLDINGNVLDSITFNNVIICSDKDKNEYVSLINNLNDIDYMSTYNKSINEQLTPNMVYLKLNEINELLLN